MTFYEDELHAAQTSDDQIYVPLRPICDYLGIAWPAQRTRLNRDPVLTAELRSVIITITEGYPRATLCLPLEALPGWLFGISAARVRPELQAKITRYRRECFRVLWQAFKGEILPAAPPATGLTPAQQTLDLINAMQRLAQQQVEIEADLARKIDQDEFEPVRNKQEVMAGWLRGFTRETRERLTALELRIGAGATISEAQATEIALTVKGIAAAFEVQGTRNGYQRVYAELYRRYGISSYKALPAARFAEAMAWLRTWQEELGEPERQRHSRGGAGEP